MALMDPLRSLRSLRSFKIQHTSSNDEMHPNITIVINRPARLLSDRDCIPISFDSAAHKRPDTLNSVRILLRIVRLPRTHARRTNVRTNQSTSLPVIPNENTDTSSWPSLGPEQNIHSLLTACKSTAQHSRPAPPRGSPHPVYPARIPASSITRIVVIRARPPSLPVLQERLGLE